MPEFEAISVHRPVARGATDLRSPLAARHHRVTFTTYRSYVLAVLFLGYVVTSGSCARGLIQSIKGEFALSDTQLGILSGITFAFFYSTLGVPIAMWADRTVRRNVLATCCALWSCMTALCGMAIGFWTLAAARAGTAVGEAGGSPPSHSLISDYYPRQLRATALSLYALGVGRCMLGQFLGGGATSSTAGTTLSDRASRPFVAAWCVHGHRPCVATTTLRRRSLCTGSPILNVESLKRMCRFATCARRGAAPGGLVFR
jgi:MFS family permease